MDAADVAALPVTAVSPLPAADGRTAEVMDRLTVTVVLNDHGGVPLAAIQGL